MSKAPALTKFGSRLREFIRRQVQMESRGEVLAPEQADAEFNRLARDLFAAQFELNPAYRQFCKARGVASAAVAHWSQIPAIPAAAFKEFELSCLEANDRRHEFRSSGTTSQRPSRHFHCGESLKLYEASLLPWFQRHLLPKVEQLPVLALTPAPVEVPWSSLVYMFGAVIRELGGQGSLYMGRVNAAGAWELKLDTTAAALEHAQGTGRSVLLLGTAFSFVHLLDHLAGLGRSLSLPAGSRVLETGGYKGRSRAISRRELHELIAHHLGIPGPCIVSEYGMSELSSQAYDRVAGDGADSGSEPRGPKSEIAGPEPAAGDRVLRFPPWARVRIVSPDTGQEVAVGERGLIQVLDLANVWSVLSVQTEDVGTRRETGFELDGRAQRAEPRGCSLMPSEP